MESLTCTYKTFYKDYTCRILLWFLSFLKQHMSMIKPVECILWLYCKGLGNQSWMWSRSVLSWNMHKRSLSFFSISYGLSNSLFEVPMVFSFWLHHRSVLSWTSTIFLSGKSFNLLFFLRFALLVCFISMIFLSH